MKIVKTLALKVRFNLVGCCILSMEQMAGRIESRFQR